MTVDVVLIAASLGAAIAYGAALTVREASFGRTLLKTAAVAALALLAFLIHRPWPLVAGLALSALGDACLSGDAERWLPAGLAAFLAAHVGYIWLFLTYGYGMGVLAAEPWRAAGAGLAAIAGVAMLAWLWRSIGPLRPAVGAPGGGGGGPGGGAGAPPARLPRLAR